MLLALGTGHTVGVASSVGITAVSTSVTSASERNYKNRQRRKRGREAKREEFKLQKTAHQTELIRLQIENQLRSQKADELSRQQSIAHCTGLSRVLARSDQQEAEILRLGKELSEKTTLLRQLKDALRSSAASKSFDLQAKKQEIASLKAELLEKQRAHESLTARNIQLGIAVAKSKSERSVQHAEHLGVAIDTVKPVGNVHPLTSDNLRLLQQPYHLRQHGDFPACASSEFSGSQPQQGGGDKLSN